MMHNNLLVQIKLGFFEPFLVCTHQKEEKKKCALEKDRHIEKWTAHKKAALSVFVLYHRMMQISPPEPSLIIRSSVS